MKKSFLFLMSALVLGMMMMTSCKKDDEGTALTSIRVDPASIELPVGESQKVTVTAIPDNATGVSYTWTSSNENVATVSDGTVTITGLGTATVTVASGNIKKDVPVTGTLKSLTVKDENNAEAGVYPFTNGQDAITFTLTATVDPAGVKPEWSVDVSTVTVAASSDGLSATVKISGEGLAVVSITAGGLTATYTITTASLFESAAGYWTFDDPNALFKATIGEDLVPKKWDEAEADIAPVAGPSADNGAASIPKFTWLYCNHGIAPNGPHTDLDGRTPHVNEFTMMFDVKIDDLLYYALFDNYMSGEQAPNGEAAFYIKSGGRLGGGNYVSTPNNTVVAGQWYRLILVCKFYEEGYYDYYLNGEHIKVDPTAEHTGAAGGETMIDHTRFALNSPDVLLFTDQQGGDGYDYNDGLSVSAVAIWDYPLTSAEVAALGGVK